MISIIVLGLLLFISYEMAEIDIHTDRYNPLSVAITILIGIFVLRNLESALAPLIYLISALTMFWVGVSILTNKRYKFIYMIILFLSTINVFVYGVYLFS